MSPVKMGVSEDSSNCKWYYVLHITIFNTYICITSKYVWNGIVSKYAENEKENN